MLQLANIDALTDFARVNRKPKTKRMTAAELEELIAQLAKMRTAAHGYTPLAG